MYPTPQPSAPAHGVWVPLSFFERLCEAYYGESRRGPKLPVDGRHWKGSQGPQGPAPQMPMPNQPMQPPVSPWTAGDPYQKVDQVGSIGPTPRTYPSLHPQGAARRDDSDETLSD